jgi:glucuronoxylan 4-O-methyltransferase
MNNQTVSLSEHAIDRVMRTRIGTGIKHVTKKVSLRLYRWTHAFGFIPPIRWATWILLSAEEMRLIYDVVRRGAPCNFLVFGLGDDSAVWDATNRQGYTIFAEDDEEWVDSVLDEYPELNVFTYTYETERHEWEDLLECHDELGMDLPESIRQRSWDVILVDAPAGYESDLPGRMQSIYTASRLAGPGTGVFVHDIDRKVESTYCDAFFSERDRKHQVQRLRHYHVTE